jgi:hypothetical protein
VPVVAFDGNDRRVSATLGRQGAVRREDARALPRELVSHAPADSVSRSGDDGDFAFESHRRGWKDYGAVEAQRLKAPPYR